MRPRPRLSRQRRSRVARRSRRDVRHRIAAAVILALTCAAAACGKKGPPLPPLVRVPQTPSPAAVRMGGEVYVTFTVPTQNVDGQSPADISRIDLLALTATTQPDLADFDRLAAKVGSVAVAPPPPAGREGEEPVAAPPSSGVAQGVVVTLTEVLTAGAATPVVLPQKKPPAAPPAGKQAVDQKPGDAAEAPEAAAPPLPRRYYRAVGVSPRGREGRSFLTSVPMRELPPPPGRPTITYSADQVTLSWDAAPDAVGYFVYRGEPQGTGPPGDTPTGPTSAPQPLNPAEEPATSFREPVVFGSQTCYHVRAVSQADGESVQGVPSATACETPVDTFPPAAPTGLRALATEGGIDLVWQPNTEPDLGGYAVLRGRAGDATLLPIAQTPSTQTRFADRTVTAGTRYVYAIVAFDAQSPPNRSAESARDDELAP